MWVNYCYFRCMSVSVEELKRMQTEAKWTDGEPEIFLNSWEGKVAPLKTYWCMVQALSLPYKTPHLVNFHSLSHRKEFKLMSKLENDTNQKSSTVIDSLKNSAALLHFLQLHELNSLLSCDRHQESDVQMCFGFKLKTRNCSVKCKHDIFCLIHVKA